jgi:hypothetical protein
MHNSTLDSNIWFVWYPDLIPVPPLNSNLVDEVGQILLQAMEKGKFENLTISTELQQDNLPRIVFISFSRYPTPAYIYRGNAFGIISALKDAFLQMAHDWGEQVLDQIVKLDIVQNCRSLGTISLDSSKVSINETLEGVAFSRESRVNLLASQLAGHAVIERKRIRRLHLYNAISHLPYLSACYALLEDSDQTEAYAFTTASVLINHKKIIPMYRGKRVSQKPTPEDLKYRLTLAAFSLVRGMYQHGRFDYSFNPQLNRSSSDYNITRHAGTVYSLFEFTQVFPHEAVLNSAKNALYHLTQHILPGSTKDSLCVVERGWAKLGSASLTAVAFSKYIEVTQDKQLLPTLLKLGEWIVDKIQADGRCFPQKVFYLSTTPSLSKYESIYYPGEAILGLLRIFLLDPNPKWLDAAERAATWLITVRDKDLKESELIHDHWLLYGLNELYRHRPKSIFIEHTKRVCNSIMAAQITESAYPDWIGGFYNPPRSTPTATRAEGLCAAFYLLRDYGSDHDYLKKILNSLEQSILFQFKTQFLEESCIYFPDPSKALGAFHGALTNYEMRIDYTQHNISSLLGLYKILSENS